MMDIMDEMFIKSDVKWLMRENIDIRRVIDKFNIMHFFCCPHF